MRNQKGFSPVLVLFLILCVGAIGFAVIKVNKSQNNAKTNISDEAKQDKQEIKDTPKQAEPNLSDSWLLRESANASIRVPDGFNFLANQTESFDFVLPEQPQGTLKYVKGEQAKIVGSPAKHFDLGLIVSYNNAGLNDRGILNREFKTYSGLDVTIKLFEQTADPEGVDFPKGTKHLKYTVKRNADFINVDYFYLGEGVVNIIEEMVKSTIIK